MPYKDPDYMKKWRAANKEHLQEYERSRTDLAKKSQRRRAAHRAARTEYLKGKACATCGATEALQIDHVDPDSKSFEVNEAFYLRADNPKRQAELSKCQVLCAPCHRDKTSDEQRGRSPRSRKKTLCPRT